MVICEMLPSSSLESGDFVLPRHNHVSTSASAALMPSVSAVPSFLAMSATAEPKSPPDVRPTHCDIPLMYNGGGISNGTGTVSGLPTPGTDEDISGNASFPVVPAPPQQLSLTATLTATKTDVKDSGDRYVVENVLRGGSGSVFGNGRGSVVNGVIGLAPAIPSVNASASHPDPVTGSHRGADSVPPNARSSNAAANINGTLVDPVQQSPILFTPPSTHNIQLVHPTPVHVTATSPSSGPLSPPRLVVVNPTPNPTPHPTPPATPVLLTSTTVGNNAALQLKGFKGAPVQYLALPGVVAAANWGESETLLPSPLLRVPGPEGRRIPEVKEEQAQQQHDQPKEQQKSTSLSSASSGYSALSATTTATSTIEETERDNKKKTEQMAPSSSAHVADGRTPVPILPNPQVPPILPTPALTLSSQFQAQLAESPVSQASMSPTNWMRRFLRS
ncbi:hypothetical protein BDQ17DRAFT_231771 [Cyathus striatus]|nr:hypothetical protein BDQ17DRAFT_231771 [Cyathus striatus]